MRTKTGNGHNVQLEQFIEDLKTVVQDGQELIRSSDLVVVATVATQPHITDPVLFNHHPVVLHVSLRDLAPEILLTATNIVDDIEHCQQANTSTHLAEQLTGSRDFLDGTLDDVIAGRVLVPADRTVVFSPFGLGVLDLAVGKFVYDEVVRSGKSLVIEDFFHERHRYGPPPVTSTATSGRRRRRWSPRGLHSSGIRLMR